jgi:hypothetical protein
MRALSRVADAGSRDECAQRNEENDRDELDPQAN